MSDCLENGRPTDRRGDAAHRPRVEAPPRPYNRLGGIFMVSGWRWRHELLLFDRSSWLLVSAFCFLISAF
jgi:hypothetical protein